MKKKLLCLLTVLMVLSGTLLTGCSDFSFNPTGKWKMADHIHYTEGKEDLHQKGKDLPFQNVRYVFEKSGTGYMTVNDTRTLSFTYEYDDTTIKLSMKDPKDPEKTTELKCEVADYPDGGKALIQQVDTVGQDENGQPYVYERDQYWYLRE